MCHARIHRERTELVWQNILYQTHSAIFLPMKVLYLLAYLCVFIIDFHCAHHSICWFFCIFHDAYRQWFFLPERIGWFRYNQLVKLDFQISKTQSAIAWESQSKKRFEYNARLKKYKEERENLLGGNNNGWQIGYEIYEHDTRKH